MKPKKIILLAHEDLYGGGTRQTFYIMRQLVEKGYETVLVSNAEKTWLGKTLAESGLPVKTYYTPLIRRDIRPLQEIKVLCYLIRVFLKEKPDVVFASGVKLIGLGGVAGWLCRVPHRWAIIRGEGAAPGTRTLAAIYCMERCMARLGTRFIAVSEYIRRQMLNRRVCTHDQVITVHDGIELDNLLTISDTVTSRPKPFTDRFSLPEDAFKIGMIGRLVAGKRYDQFIELLHALCERYPHVYGILIGEGEHRKQLEAQIGSGAYSDRLLVAGFCQDMPSAYGDLDMTVLLTDYEGCPNSVLESMAAGVPAIASDVCGISEIIQDGENGFLIAPGDIQTAVQRISDLIDDQPKRSRMAKTGQQFVQQHFNVNQQVSEIIQALFPSES